jgi:hypothetical protein
LIYFFNNRNNLKLEKFDPNSTGNSNTFKGFGHMSRVGNTRRLNTKFSVPGGDKLTFYIPQNFVHIIKSESNMRSNRHHKGSRFADTHGPAVSIGPTHVGGPGGTGLNSQKGDGSSQNQSTKLSNHFREFIKFVQKTGKGCANRRIHPGLKEIINCKEYKDYEIKKTLMVEIKEWIIPMGNSEDRGIKVLLFKIPKNQGDVKPDEYSFEKSAREGRNPPSVIAASDFSKSPTNVRDGFIEQKTFNNSSARHSNVQKTVTIRGV